MKESNPTRRTVLAAAAAIPLASVAAASEELQSSHPKDANMTSRTFIKTAVMTRKFLLMRFSALDMQ
jgi:hypothetical protein